MIAKILEMVKTTPSESKEEIINSMWRHKRKKNVAAQLSTSGHEAKISKSEINETFHFVTELPFKG